MKTPIGYLPAPGAINTEGLQLPDDTMTRLLTVDAEEWRKELPLIAEHYRSLGERVPSELIDQLRSLERRFAFDRQTATVISQE